MMPALAALLGTLVATAFAQVAYKKFVLGHGRVHLLLAMALFGLTPLLSYIAVKAFGIALVFVSASTTYALVALLGVLMFDERISRRQGVALGFIVCGSLIYGLGAEIS